MSGYVLAAVCVLGAVLAHGGSPVLAFVLGLGTLVVVVLSVVAHGSLR